MWKVPRHPDVASCHHVMLVIIYISIVIINGIIRLDCIALGRVDVTKDMHALARREHLERMCTAVGDGDDCRPGGKREGWRAEGRFSLFPAHGQLSKAEETEPQPASECAEDFMKQRIKLSEECRCRLPTRVD